MREQPEVAQAPARHEASHASAEQVKELVELADEMIRFGRRHWMHDEGQNVRMFGERIKQILRA